MTKVINETYEFQILRAQSALLKLRSMYAVGTAELYGGTRLYRMAVARRYSVVYFAFLNYLLSRLRVERDTESLGMEDIIHRCRRQNVLTSDDERMVAQMSMLYASLTYFNQGFDGKSDDLLKDIPRMCDFMERFIGFQTITPVTTAGLEASL